MQELDYERSQNTPATERRGRFIVPIPATERRGRFIVAIADLSATSDNRGNPIALPEQGSQLQPCHPERSEG